MDHHVVLKATVLWLAILVCAMLNGALREKVLISTLGYFTGLIISGLILSTCIFVVAVAAAPWYGRLQSLQWVLLGVYWLTLTLAFEFGFGHFVQHNTWQELLEAYTFKGGNIWPIVPVTALISPWVAAKLRGLM